ncbi:hypothetical protein BXZ70DRAFT_908952 [Cristinia sonorae]|uniref:Uncharacterized protein n=1 Tax=Cristinia sonorae TaxID=1940300 RepID=A0A8K0XMR9_9AGAR|nr:hypothetical protein BXZ70DRAFT_908952 [Cristinia sonorae]
MSDGPTARGILPIGEGDIRVSLSQPGNPRVVTVFRAGILVTSAEALHTANCDSKGGARKIQSYDRATGSTEDARVRLQNGNQNDIILTFCQTVRARTSGLSSQLKGVIMKQGGNGWRPTNGIERPGTEFKMTKGRWTGNRAPVLRCKVNLSNTVASLADVLGVRTDTRPNSTAGGSSNNIPSRRCSVETDPEDGLVKTAKAGSHETTKG